ncbi:MAG TPA: hypothetical protein VND23_07860 [Acidimicrobiales bacterium]|nr:hypothetical protein [Acidimicrobiales bacterium]
MGPKCGLQLRKVLGVESGEVWPLDTGRVRTTPQRLDRNGLVESAGLECESSQKGSRVMDAGSRELSSWSNTPPDTTSPPRAELAAGVSRGCGSQVYRYTM